MFKKIFVVVLSLLLVVSFSVIAVSTSFAGKKKEVLIGALYPMTGRAGLYGKDSVAAVEMAVNEINSKGGVAGYKLNVLFTDSKVNPAYSVRVAKRYILEDKVNFLFGVVSSGVGLAVTQVSK